MRWFQKRACRRRLFHPEWQAAAANVSTQQNLQGCPPTREEASWRVVSRNTARTGQEKFRCDAGPSKYCWDDLESGPSFQQVVGTRSCDRCRRKATSRMSELDAPDHLPGYGIRL